MNTTHLTIEQITAIATKAAIEAVHAALEADKPAKTTRPKAAAKPQPKADGKIYRSKPGKERAKVEIAAVWEDAKAKAGVKRVRDLTPKQRAAADAKVKAIWAAVPKTRTTKG